MLLRIAQHLDSVGNHADADIIDDNTLQLLNDSQQDADTMFEQLKPLALSLKKYYKSPKSVMIMLKPHFDDIQDSHIKNMLYREIYNLVIN